MASLEYFPGAITPLGFFSYYDYILKSHEANRIIILKGGPGTGKSTFVKKVLKHLLDLGYETEILHCSSDPNSLDGVCAREIGFLIIDGTSPHIVDPKCPGAVDEIINLGECWDKDKIAKNKTKIIEIGEKNSSYYKDAYRYLSAAKKLKKQSEIVNMDLIEEELKKLKPALLLEKTTKGKGNERKAFLSAITPLGRINYIDTFSKKAKCVYKVQEESTKTAQMFMMRLADMLKCLGYDIRTFYCPMSPDEKIEHIYVNDVLISIENEYHNLADNGNVIKFDERSIDNFDFEQYNLLLNRAEEMIKSAKKLHDDLEQLYVPYMDFDKVESLCNKVISSIK